MVRPLCIEHTCAVERSDTRSTAGCGAAVPTLTPVGAYSFIDAVHGAPHRLIDVKEIGCDFLGLSACVRRTSNRSTAATQPVVSAFAPKAAPIASVAA